MKDIGHLGRKESRVLATEFIIKIGMKRITDMPYDLGFILTEDQLLMLTKVTSL